jgi:5-methyltetrahydrofolate--homocysteine methyltransferase
MENILKRLQRGDVIVGDGAVGTFLIERGLKHGEPPEGFNLTRPEVLEEIASLYLAAGAEIVTTNTFGASPLRLQRYSMENEVEAINRSAVEAARRAVGNKAYVTGCVGPTGKMLKPYGSADPEEVTSGFRRQIAALLSAGIDAVFVETMNDLNEAALAVKAARSLDSAIPILATVTFNKNPQGYFTLMGSSPKDAAAALEKAGADIIGSNCGQGAAQMVEIAREFKTNAHVPIAIQSNAGLPVRSETGVIYPETPEFLAAKAVELLDLGIQLIGGCCGTGPDHIRAMRKAVDAYKSSCAEKAQK